MEAEIKEKLECIADKIGEQVNALNKVEKELYQKLLSMPAFLKESGKGRQLRIDLKNIQDQRIHVAVAHRGVLELAKEA